MSREEDDTRQYQCLRKYEAIVKQVCGTSVFRFDELINMVDARTRSRRPKRRRVAVSSSTSSAQPGSGRGSTSSAAATPSHQPVASMDEVFVQTITRFLHELNTTPAHRDDGNSSNANEDIN